MVILTSCKFFAQGLDHSRVLCELGVELILKELIPLTVLILGIRLLVLRLHKKTGLYKCMAGIERLLGQVNV